MGKHAAIPTGLLPIAATACSTLPPVCLLLWPPLVSSAPGSFLLSCCCLQARAAAAAVENHCSSSLASGWLSRVQWSTVSRCTGLREHFSNGLGYHCGVNKGLQNPLSSIWQDHVGDALTPWAGREVWHSRGAWWERALNPTWQGHVGDALIP